MWWGKIGTGFNVGVSVLMGEWEWGVDEGISVKEAN